MLPKKNTRNTKGVENALNKNCNEVDFEICRWRKPRI